jgi:hypothetical protein
MVKGRVKLPQQDSDRLREGLSRFMKSRGLTITGWCRRAGITEGTLRSFLAGRSQTLTHASLAALAYAAQEPITALLSGRSVWAKTEVIDVSVEVCGAERSGDSIFLGDDDRYQVRLPKIFVDVTKFAARISDASANERWGPGSLLICADLAWESVFAVLKEGDFIIIEEKRDDFVEDQVVRYVRCTVRELIRESEQEYLVMRSRSPRFRDSIRLNKGLIDTVTKDSIVTGLGTQITVFGKVLASYCIEDTANKRASESV